MDYPAQIISIEGAPVRRITLRVEDDYTFKAGQYLLVDGGSSVHIPLSIASAPHTLPLMHLHYRSTPGSAEAAAMDAALEGAQLRISSAQGDVGSGDAAIDQLMVVGGSGAAQAFSCALHRAHERARGATTVLWCADHAQDLYAQDRLRALDNTTLYTVVDDRRTPENEGLVWLGEHAAEYRAAQVLICGSPGFVYAVTDTLLGAGLQQAQLRADAYAYAPRV